jgi:hypothetical protein
MQYTWDGPEPYLYTVHDRIFGDFTAKNTVYTPYIYVLANPKYTWDWPEPYIYPPYMTVRLMQSLKRAPYTRRIHTVLANPNFVFSVAPSLPGLKKPRQSGSS